MMHPPEGDADIRPRVLLADDHNLLLEGLKKLLAGAFDIVGTAFDGRELVSATLKMRPDLVVLDIGMPVLNGMDAARQICQAAPQTKIVFLTQQSDKAYIQQAFRVGASGYVLKQSATSELKQALYCALEGKRYVSAALANCGRLPESNCGGAAADQWSENNLTPRQREILLLLAQGKTLKDIAQALGISVTTIEFHISAVMDDLGLITSEELMRCAAQLLAHTAGGKSKDSHYA